MLPDASAGLDEGGTHDRVAAGRQPGRDRPPDHPDRPAARASARSRCTPRPTPACRSCAEADEAVCIGPANPAQSYRNAEAILAAAKSTGAQAIHPGYGFLVRERRLRPYASRRSGLIWVGPGADAITAMGDKINARNLMAAAGVPVAPGTTDPAADVDAAVAAAAEHRLPGDGQGRGRRRRHGHGRRPPTRRRCAPSTTRCARFAERMFGDGSVLIERYFPRVRHVEVQILGLADGRVVALGERECSVQRRNQKLVEESPSPGRVTPSCARGCWPRRCGPARRSATATPAPSSACSTRPPASSSSWR